jgi:hypothetical protein
MRQRSPAVVIESRHLARQGLRDVGLGFLYWLGFVLILEPGNLLRWVPPNAAAWAHEGLRLVGAGLLGGIATPAILALTRRLPIEGPNAWRRGAAHLLFCAAMTVVMIVASCLLAALLPNTPHQPLLHSVAEELAANGSLVAAWIAGLTLLAHAVRRARGGEVDRRTSTWKSASGAVSSALNWLTSIGSRPRETTWRCTGPPERAWSVRPPRPSRPDSILAAFCAFIDAASWR